MPGDDPSLRADRVLFSNLGLAQNHVGQDVSPLLPRPAFGAIDLFKCLLIVFFVISERFIARLRCTFELRIDLGLRPSPRLAWAKACGSLLPSPNGRYRQ